MRQVAAFQVSSKLQRRVIEWRREKSRVGEVERDAKPQGGTKVSAETEISHSGRVCLGA